MTLDDFLIRKKEATYMLRVTGDSMINAGLLPGDLVLVERRANAKDGDIVIAQVDGGWTMKYFRTRGGKISLEPANKKYRPIVPKEELHIVAIVIAAIRKY
jgi:repressor LexA